MFFAIANNRLDFVKLFLDKGVSLKEFLTVERIHQLYNDVRRRRRHSLRCSSSYNKLIQDCLHFRESLGYTRQETNPWDHLPRTLLLLQILFNSTTAPLFSLMLGSASPKPWERRRATFVSGESQILISSNRLFRVRPQPPICFCWWDAALKLETIKT